MYERYFNKLSKIHLQNVKIANIHCLVQVHLNSGKKEKMRFEFPEGNKQKAAGRNRCDEINKGEKEIVRCAPGLIGRLGTQCEITRWQSEF